jgi:hypothetical protein
MPQTYATLRVAHSDKGVLNVVIDAPPMNLIGPDLVRDLVTLLGELESSADTLVMVLESADPEYFVPHVDLTKVAEYTAEAAKAAGPDDVPLTSTPTRPNGTAGSIARCPTTSWTGSWPSSPGASHRSRPMRCGPPSRRSTS